MHRFFLALVCAALVVVFVPLSVQADYPVRPCSVACGDDHESRENTCRRELDSCNHTCGVPWNAACNEKCSEYWCACLSRACDEYERCARESKCRRKPYFERSLCNVCYKDR